MIAGIKGRICEKRDGGLLMEVNGIIYEVLVPPAVMSSILENEGETVGLVIYHYFQNDQSRGIPFLIGFMNEIEKEFFEKFITVSGVGPKAACKALAQPFSLIADAIDAGDIKLLKALPGIGERKAREIIAKLQGKVGKFGLIQDRHLIPQSAVAEDIRKEALSVLLQLQYKKKEAEDMIDKAASRSTGIGSTEDLLNEVYRQKSAPGGLQ
ncbi:MAG: Holliday junction branch migration protein RuvA [Candidatus Omnitrophota bacterium]